MKKTLLLLLYVLAAHAAWAKLRADNTPRQAAPFLFMENKGQVHDQDGNAVPAILFTVAEGSFKAQLTKNGIHYSFQKVNNPEVLERKVQEDSWLSAKGGDTAHISYTIQRIDMRLLGANPHPQLVKEGRSDYYENYYTAGCGENGVTGVHGYTTITYKNIYDGIDWVIYAKGGKLKYDFIVHAGADAGQIKIQYTGADGLWLNADGSFTAHTVLGNVEEGQPLSFVQDGKKRIVSKYELKGNILGFSVERSKETIVIDPAINWSTYYYGAMGYAMWQYGLHNDGVGGVYISGTTSSTSNLATTGAFQTVYGGGNYDAYIAKFNSAGNRLWATYYGGSDNEVWANVKGDGVANVLLAGTTYSINNIATTGAHQAVLGGVTDAFLARFTNAGILTWATYYGGNANEGFACALSDGNGNIYFTGSTSSGNNISTAGSNQATMWGTGDAFLVKFSSNGTRLWGTYLGGTDWEMGCALAVNPTGDIFVAGSTNSTAGMATAGSFQTVFGGGPSDVFLAKISAGGILQWSTYYGGAQGDGQWTGFTNFCDGWLKCDGTGNVYLGSITSSIAGIATAGAWQTSMAGGSDAFLVKFDGNGTRLWGTYYGGVSEEYLGSISLDANATSIYMAGDTKSSSGIATPGAYQSQNMGFSDAFFARFNAWSGQLVWGSYLGGAGNEIGSAVKYEGGGVFYIGGSSSSTGNIATPGAFLTSWNGINCSGFLAKFTDSFYSLHTGSVPLVYCQGDSLHIPITGTSWLETGNVFTVQLSNATGSFATPVVLGSKTSSSPSEILHVKLPVGVNGTGYRIRVLSSVPALISDTLSLVINPLVAPIVVITAGNTAICSGGTVSFTATVANGGSQPTYTWIKNGVVVGSGPSYTANGNWLATDSIYCVVTSNAPCALNAIDTSNVLYLVVQPVVQPVVSINGTGLITCPGQTVNFTATVANGGIAPVYQWQRNGTNTGTNSPGYSAANFVNGDVVTCVVTSSNPCAVPASVTGNALTITITTVVPTIHIAASDSFFCYGRPATFTAAVTNGGTQHQYQWMKNGFNAGPNAPMYKDSFFVNGDIITCKLTSNNPCAVPAQVVSNPLTLKVSPILNPIIVRNGNSLKVNVNINPAFVNFQWFLNNSPLPGATSQTITITQNGMYQVWATDTSGCKSVSALAWIQDLAVGNSNIAKEQVKVYPNPAAGWVMIEAPEKLNATVRNALGQVVLKEEMVERINVSYLAAGIYALQLSDKKGMQVYDVKLIKIY